MIIALDFDDTIIYQSNRPYGDVSTPLQFLPGAKEGLYSLKKAGHTLLLYSARANRSLREDSMLDPLIRSGARKFDQSRWESSRLVNEARYQQMVEFVNAEIPGVFDAIDDGMQGKPVFDLLLDDKAVRIGYGVGAFSWRYVAHNYGEPNYDSEIRKESVRRTLDL